jgi:hypothetical protein
MIVGRCCNTSFPQHQRMSLTVSAEWPVAISCRIMVFHQVQMLQFNCMTLLTVWYCGREWHRRSLHASCAIKFVSYMVMDFVKVCFCDHCGGFHSAGCLLKFCFITLAYVPSTACSFHDQIIPEWYSMSNSVPAAALNLNDVADAWHKPWAFYVLS